MTAPRDHGGGLDHAMASYGGARADWLDLSTGINPVPYPIGEIEAGDWTVLPDRAAQERLLDAARQFWNVPDDVAIVAAPGTSALITRMPELSEKRAVHIPRPTYNEHAAAFALHGYSYEDEPDAPVRVFVHPNNPDGQVWDRRVIYGDHKELTIVDESFCDVTPGLSHMAQTREPGIVVLKSFGKFWGLAGLRLGFAMGRPHTLARFGCGAEDPVDLREMLGPWAVSGPALRIGARALEDQEWARTTRARLASDAREMDAQVTAGGRAQLVGGTDLFRLYDVGDAARWQDHLARHKIWSRVFPYSTRWLRLGLPHRERRDQLRAALDGL